jgi:phenylacetate-CoA ligase
MAYHLRGQAQYPFKPLVAIKADQARRVRRMVAYAYRYVPYYRETMGRLGLRPTDFQSAEDLARLPMLEREHLQRDPEYFVSTAQPLARYLPLRSGGSAGAPRTVYHDARSLYQHAAYGGRARAAISPRLGRSMGYRKTIVSSGWTPLVQQFYRNSALLPRGVALHRQQLSLLDPLETNLPLINAFKPDVIHSYGSYLAMLFRYLHATGEPFHQPRALLYTSDGLPEPARNLIRGAFRIPVFGIYEATEVSNIGFECEQHKGLHLSIDLCPLRIVDTEGRALPDGESGDVVISNLINRATVLLNYRIGDIAAFLPGQCPCGRSLPLLSQVQGRSNDWIELVSGQMIHPEAVTEIFAQEEHIWQFQVVQQTTTHFSVALVTAKTCDHLEAKARITAEFARTLGGDITVDIRFVDSLERTATGKVRPVISMCSREPFDSQGRGHGTRSEAAQAGHNEKKAYQ